MNKSLYVYKSYCPVSDECGRTKCLAVVQGATCRSTICHIYWRNVEMSGAFCCCFCFVLFFVLFLWDRYDCSIVYLTFRFCIAWFCLFSLCRKIGKSIDTLLERKQFCLPASRCRLHRWLRHLPGWWDLVVICNLKVGKKCISVALLANNSWRPSSLTIKKSFVQNYTVSSIRIDYFLK